MYILINIISWSERICICTSKIKIWLLFGGERESYQFKVVDESVVLAIVVFC